MFKPKAAVTIPTPNTPSKNATAPPIRFPLLLFIGSDPSPEAFFGDAFDHLAERLSLARKDFIPPWTSLSSLAVYKSPDYKAYNLDFLLVVAMRDWGEACIRDSVQEVFDLPEMLSKLLIIREIRAESKPTELNSKYITNWFPRQCAFKLPLSSGINEKSECQEALILELQNYRATFSPASARQGLFDFRVQIERAEDLHELKKKTSAILDLYRMPEFMGWRECEHNLWFYSGWQYSDGNDTGITTACKQCASKAGGKAGK